MFQKLQYIIGRDTFRSSLNYLVGLALTVFVATLIYIKSVPSLKLALVIMGLGILVWVFMIFLPKSLPKATFLMIVFFGSISTFVTPINDVPDEYVHFARSLYISEGDVNLTDKSEDLLVSEDVLKIDAAQRALLFDERLEKQWHSDKEVEYPNLKGTNAYYSLSYFPQVFGLVLGRLFQLPLKQTYYLGRFFNLLIYAITIYLAIILAGSFGQVIAVLGLLPMSIYLAGSYNQDGFALGLILLIVSLFSRMTQVEKISNRLLFAYYILCSLIVVTKFPYLLLVGLPLFLPSRLFKGKFTLNLLNRGLGVLVIILLAGIWYKLYSQISSPYDADFLKQVDPAMQISSLLSNPIKYGGVLLREMFDKLIKPDGIFQYGYLSYGTVNLFAAYAVYLTIVILNNSGKIQLTRKTQLGSIIVALGIAGANVLALYLSWTPVGALHVLGVQARYFIGLLPLLLLVAISNKIFQSGRDMLNNRAILMIASLFLVTMLLSTLFEYYPI
ncbi:DUF2142 domain-containing protein [Streptococcus sp. E17BB]|uniref:DUF2142 domain-containing protein n=1 Tax=Streptococcus sp. E17BB TaxID=3278714 RepID=UPI00359E024C